MMIVEPLGAERMAWMRAERRASLVGRGEELVAGVLVARACNVGTRAADGPVLRLDVIDHPLHAAREPDGREPEVDPREVGASSVRVRSACSDSVSRSSTRAMLTIEDSRTSAPTEWRDACRSSTHDATSCSQRKRPISRRRSFSSTGRKTLSMNAAKPSSPCQGFSRRPSWVSKRRVPNPLSNRLQQLEVAVADEVEEDRRLEPDLDAVARRHGHDVDAGPGAALGIAGDRVEQLDVLRRVLVRRLREPSRPRQPLAREQELADVAAVERPAVAHDADVADVLPRDGDPREHDDEDERHHREHARRDPQRTLARHRAERPRSRIASRAGAVALPPSPVCGGVEAIGEAVHRGR